MSRFFDTPRKRVVIIALGCWLIVLGVMTSVPVPYVRLAPGPMFDVLGDSDGQQIIAVAGAKTYPTTGQLDMTTVTERGGPFGDLTLFEAFTGWLDPKVAVVPTSLLYPPDTSSDDAEQQGADQFADSQEKARIAALRQVGEPVETRPWVQEVLKDSPAEGVLEHGDVVLRANGTEVDSPKQLAKVVQDAGPDADVVLDIRRDDKDTSVEVTTVASPIDSTKGYIGLSLGVQADSPVTVDFHLDDIGGPSAGLIFSLGIVDKLTADDLLDGRFVAGTGTMDDDGKVGAIGGIAQKLAAAKQNGAELFLAPKDNCDEIPAATPEGLTVAAVETLDEAVRVLEGSMDPPSCPVA